MDDDKIILEIKKIYEKYILKDADAFCVDDYNKFEEEIWMLKEKYQLKENPFSLLPEPAEDADYEMMNASNDGLTEPDKKDITNYLEKMKTSYSKL